MNVRKYFICLLVIFSNYIAISQSSNWSNDIADIIYTKCTSCHRSGGIAPFTLENYQECIDNLTDIKRVVEKGIMPPWPPDQAYSRFAHERSLTADQKTKLLNWINNGSDRGDITKEPSLPVFPSNGDLNGTPDAKYLAPLFTVKATADIYQCFVIKNTENIDRYINAMEVIPGNRNSVHHVLVYYDKSGQAKKHDDASQEPGYLSFGGIGVSSAELIGAWVPGSFPTQYPSGMGVKLPAGGDIVMQIHYPGSANGQMDQTLLKLYYSKEANVRQVFISPILDHLGTLINGPLIIPANSVKTFTSEYKINSFKTTVLSVAPHMHLIGKSIEVFAQDPNGTKKNLIKINDWDFHWQGAYSYPKPIVFNPGTKLTAHATYDNTSNNLNNPNNPPKLVTLGEKTTDEMLLVYFTFLLYQSGDENIIVDSSFLNSSLSIIENSDSEWSVKRSYMNIVEVEISDYLKGSLLTLYNSSGNFICNYTLSENMNRIYIPEIGLNGIIYLNLKKSNFNSGKKLLINTN